MHHHDIHRKVYCVDNSFDQGKVRQAGNERTICASLCKGRFAINGLCDQRRVGWMGPRIDEQVDTRTFSGLPHGFDPLNLRREWIETSNLHKLIFKVDADGSSLNDMTRICSNVPASAT